MSPEEYGARINKIVEHLHELDKEWCKDAILILIELWARTKEMESALHLIAGTHGTEASSPRVLAGDLLTFLGEPNEKGNRG